MGITWFMLESLIRNSQEGTVYIFFFLAQNLFSLSSVDGEVLVGGNLETKLVAMRNKCFQVGFESLCGENVYFW